MHAQLESHAKSFVPILELELCADDYNHLDHDLDLSSKHEEEHEHECVEPHRISPKRTRSLRDIYAHISPQDTGDLVGDLMDPGMMRS